MTKLSLKIAAATAALTLGAITLPAQAHVSVVPGVSATGNTTDALTDGAAVLTRSTYSIRTSSR